MNAQTEKPALPAEITVSTLAKWLDNAEPKHPQIRFKVRITGPGGTMDVDYSGGILAFLTHEDRRKIDRTRVTPGVSSPVIPSRMALVHGPIKYVYQEKEREQVIREIFSLSKIDPLNVIQCMILDADSGEMPFSDFCSEMGYDEDSRKARAIWETCNEQGAKFRRIVGKLMDELRELTADL